MSIEFKNVTFRYRAHHDVLNDISLSIHAGSVLLVVGQNGVGKSTLLKLMNGILKPTQGQVFVNALDTALHPTSRLAAEVCVTFQNPADQIFAPTVEEEVGFAPRNLKRSNANALVSEALALCSLQACATHHPYDLPLPQRKMLTVASALSSGCTFLAFDEPTAGLSQLERSVFEHMLRALRAKNRGLIVVSHDLAFFLPYATSVLVLGDGRRVFLGTPDELLNHEGYLRKAGLKLPIPLRLAKWLGEGYEV
jgi:energy-coupling factor transport system ATP-binding protein